MGQWYKDNKELFNLEVKLMKNYKPTAKYGFLKDGRMYWDVTWAPIVNKHQCRTYRAALVYEPNHPIAMHGSSVRAYLISPTVNELQRRVNALPHLQPKSIPHMPFTEDGSIYICTLHEDDTNPKEGIISGAANLRALFKWIFIFELCCMDTSGKAWELFQKHKGGF